MSLPEEITIEVDGKKRRVRTSDYVRVKVMALRDFGYPTVNAKEVREQLSRILSNEGDLTVIGMFMADDIVKPQEESEASE